MGNRYSMMLEKAPLLTKGVSSAVVAFGGDIMCQSYVEKREVNQPLDYGRATRFTIFGGVMVAPILHYWYGYLAIKFPMKAGQNVLIPAIQRLALDQGLFAPFIVPFSMFSLLTMEGHSLDYTVLKMKQDFWTSLQANWSIWIPGSFLNFYLIPVSYQVLFSNVTALIWNTILSYMAYRKPVMDEKEKIDN